MKTTIDPSQILEEIPGSQPAKKEIAIHTGYMVAMSEDGQLHFQLLGNDPGLGQVYGCQRYADEQIQKISDQRLNTGDALVNMLIREVGRLNNQLAQLLAKS